MNKVTKFAKVLNPSVGALFNWYDLISSLGDKDDTSMQDAFNDVGKGISNWWKYSTHSGITDQQIEENEMMRENRRTEYTDLISGMENAGLNPGLMYQSAPSSSGNSAPAASSGSLSDLLQLAMMPVEIAKAKAEIGKINADEQNTRSRTRGQDISNEFAVRLNESALESQKVSRELDRASVRRIEKEIDKMDADIALTCQSIAESVSREMVNDANVEKITAETFESSTRALLNRASANRIAALLPYEQSLMTAKTEAERAAAGLAAAQAAYQNGLIDNGYIEDLCKSVGADAAIKDVEAALKNPNYEYKSGVLDKPGRAFAACLSAILTPFKGIVSL